MAAVAEVLCLLLPDDPYMGLVAVLTVEARLCHMQVMLPHLGLVAVAGLQAILI